MSRGAYVASIRKIIAGLEELEAEVAKLRDARVSPDTYSSDSLPVGTSRRTFMAVCRAGRVADAHKDGRSWICSRAAWHEARARKPVEQPSAEATEDDDEGRVSGYLEAAGFRVLPGPKRAREGRRRSDVECPTPPPRRQMA